MTEENKEYTVPTPLEMLDLADHAQGEFELEDYYDAILRLRGYGWSDRRIAKWFTGHGIKATFSQIYYVRTKSYGALRDAALDQGFPPDMADEIALEGEPLTMLPVNESSTVAKAEKLNDK